MAQYCHAPHEVYHEGVAQRAHNLSPVPFGAAKATKGSSYHCSDTAVLPSDRVSANKRDGRASGRAGRAETPWTPFGLAATYAALRLGRAPHICPSLVLGPRSLVDTQSTEHGSPALVRCRLVRTCDELLD